MKTDTFNGITKTLSCPYFPEGLKGGVEDTATSGQPYVIVVPIPGRNGGFLDKTPKGLMKGHTDATVACLGDGKRKLYHSSGLDDWDFTYFETSSAG
ncbi:MAG: hypothetical protein IPO99_11345 [Nitrospira sp.]|nr:hypothetical protein [Nitrospira sp.]